MIRGTAYPVCLDDIANNVMKTLKKQGRNKAGYILKVGSLGLIGQPEESIKF